MSWVSMIEVRDERYYDAQFMWGNQIPPYPRTESGGDRKPSLSQRLEQFNARWRQRMREQDRERLSLLVERLRFAGDRIRLAGERIRLAQERSEQLERQRIERERTSLGRLAIRLEAEGYTPFWRRAR